METGTNNLSGTEVFKNLNLLTDTSKNFNVGLLLEPNTFSVIISEKNSGIPALIKSNIPSINSSYTELKNLIGSLNIEIKSLVALIDEPVNTLIPKTLFIEENATDYLSFNYGENNNRKIKTDDVLTLKAINIYDFAKEEFGVLEKLFPRISFHHVNTIRIELLARINKFNKDLKIYISGNKTAVSLFVFKAGSLIFSNQFQYRGKEDILYFILFTCEQLNLPADSVAAFLFDFPASDIELKELITSYFKKVSLIDSPLLSVNAVENDVASQHFTLLNMQLCE